MKMLGYTRCLEPVLAYLVIFDTLHCLLDHDTGVKELSEHAAEQPLADLWLDKQHAVR